MLSPVLAFRPARVVERLPPRSGACILSSKDLVRAAAALRLTLPVVQAPSPGVARAALVAAKQAHSVLGLSLPPGPRPAPWFAEVARAADEVAAGLPVFLAGEVAVHGAGAEAVEAAFADAWALADAGLTHLTVDLAEVPAEERPDVLERVAAPALERGLGLDCAVDRGGGAEAGALFGDLARRDAAPDVASLRLEAPVGPEAVRGQLRELLALCAALSGTPIVRRGPVTPALLQGLRGSPVAGCDDGGAAAGAAVAVIPWARLGLAARDAAGGGLARAEAALGEDGLSRLEASVYGEVLDFLSALGATGSATRVVRLFEGRLAAGDGP